MGLYEVSLSLSLLVFFTLFYCLLELSCSECDVMSLYFFVFLC